MNDRFFTGDVMSLGGGCCCPILMVFGSGLLLFGRTWLFPCSHPIISPQIGPVLAALGIPLTEYPPYASHILVELFQNTTDGSYHVGLQYNGEDVSSLECPTPPQLCPWSSFVLSLIRVCAFTLNIESSLRLHDSVTPCCCNFQHA